MKNKEFVKFSFILSGGEEISRVIELRGIDNTNFVRIRRAGERYIIEIGPHTIDLPDSMMKELVENILLIYPDDEDLQKIIETLAQDRPWLFEKFRR